MTKVSRFSLAVLLIPAIVLNISSGCAKKSERKKKSKPVMKIEKGGNLNYMIREPVSIDPVDIEDSDGMEVGANLYDGLVQINRQTLEVEAAVAKSWKSSKDAMVWTFKIRPGSKFHNGREVEAQDFKYAWERICKRDSGSTVAYHLAPVQGFEEMQAGTATELSGVKVKDRYTLEITLKFPWAEFIYVLAHPALSPVPKEEVEKDPKAFSEMPIGNGPFMMAEPWKHNREIKIVPFKDYYGTKPILDSVTFKIFDSEETAFLEFKAGNLDFTKVPTGQVEAIKTSYGEGEYEGKSGHSLLLGSELAIYYYSFNMESPLFKDNADLRKAISLAVNREVIAEAVYEGTREPATRIVPRAVPGFRTALATYVKYDPRKAKELLMKAGYPNGQGADGQQLKIQIFTNAGYDHEAPAQILQQNLKDIGIEATINSLGDSAYRNAEDQGQLDFFRLGWIADYPIMDSFLYPLFHSSNIPTKEKEWLGDNRSRYNSPEVDKMLDDARKETDKKKRIKMYQKVEDKLLSDAVIVPLVFYRHEHVVAKKVKGLFYGAQNIADLNTVWISGE